MVGIMADGSTTQLQEKQSNSEAVSVQVEHIRKYFGDQEVLKGFSFEVAPREIFVIMGPSGSGKSVCLRTIMGLLHADGGKVLVNGCDAADPQTHKNHITTIVFQAGALFNSMNVYDNLALYPREHKRYDRHTLQDKVMNTLERLSLEHAAYKMPAELSGGMKKRVAIARALMMEPQLLLYDEPTSELDPETAAMIADVIASLREQFEVTSLVVSHDRDLAMSISDRLAMMFDGDIHAIGTPKQIREKEDPRIHRFLNPVIKGSPASVIR